MKKYDIIFIEWLDSCSDSRTWIDENEFNYESHDKAMHYKTVGFFVKKTKVATYVCLSMRVNMNHGGSNCSHIMAIPNLAILSMRRMNVHT